MSSYVDPDLPERANPFACSYYLTLSLLFAAHTQILQLFLLLDNSSPLPTLVSSSDSSLSPSMLTQGAQNLCQDPRIFLHPSLSVKPYELYDLKLFTGFPGTLQELPVTGAPNGLERPWSTALKLGLVLGIFSGQGRGLGLLVNVGWAEPMQHQPPRPFPSISHSRGSDCFPTGTSSWSLVISLLLGRKGFLLGELGMEMGMGRGGGTTRAWAGGFLSGVACVVGCGHMRSWALGRATLKCSTRWSTLHWDSGGLDYSPNSAITTWEPSDKPPPIFQPPRGSHPVDRRLYDLLASFSLNIR